MNRICRASFRSSSWLDAGVTSSTCRAGGMPLERRAWMSLSTSALITEAKQVHLTASNTISDEVAMLPSEALTCIESPAVKLLVQSGGVDPRHCPFVEVVDVALGHFANSRIQTPTLCAAWPGEQAMSPLWRRGSRASRSLRVPGPEIRPSTSSFEASTPNQRQHRSPSGGSERP